MNKKIINPADVDVKISSLGNGIDQVIQNATVPLCGLPGVEQAFQLLKLGIENELVNYNTVQFNETIGHVNEVLIGNGPSAQMFNRFDNYFLTSSETIKNFTCYDQGDFVELNLEDLQDSICLLDLTKYGFSNHLNFGIKLFKEPPIIEEASYDYQNQLKFYETISRLSDGFYVIELEENKPKLFMVLNKRVSVNVDGHLIHNGNLNTALIEIKSPDSFEYTMYTYSKIEGEVVIHYSLDVMPTLPYQMNKVIERHLGEGMKMPKVTFSHIEELAGNIRTKLGELFIASGSGLSMFHGFELVSLPNNIGQKARLNVSGFGVKVQYPDTTVNSKYLNKLLMDDVFSQLEAISISLESLQNHEASIERIKHLFKFKGQDKIESYFKSELGVDLNISIY